MMIRFLALAESDAPSYPFMPGQVISVPDITDRVARWLREGLAEIVREEPELATVGPAERAVTRKGRMRAR